MGLMKQDVKRAVVLLSGGLDSATALAMAKDQGYECYVLSFDYGQRSLTELNAARAIATQIGVADHRVLRLHLEDFGGSALTDTSHKEEKKGEKKKEKKKGDNGHGE
eukprot:Anaeramoba_flamelloidesa1070773_30.p4 GENE.a1070773_30~~a1070773_30.p4  ORF type:complete len:107 (+),score=15.88 a1070773_30:548-868(+)